MCNNGVTPFAPGVESTYAVEDGNFYVDGQTFAIRVDKNVNLYPDEAQNFVDGNIAGALQKIGAKARWGNEFFNYGTGNGQSWGRIVSTIGTNMASLITDLQNTPCDTWTPLAEAYYVAMQYFKQEPPQSGLQYPNNAVPCANIGEDPFYNGTEYVPCAKSFVIPLTDGNSTMDMRVPSSFTNLVFKFQVSQFNPPSLEPETWNLETNETYRLPNVPHNDRSGQCDLVVHLHRQCDLPSHRRRTRSAATRSCRHDAGTHRVSF